MLKKIVTGTLLALLLGSVLFSAISLVGGEIAEHDLVVFWEKPILYERNHLRNGTSTVLNATVFNNGSSIEHVTLQLLINGTYVLNSSTTNLAPDHFFWSAYYWAPEEGDYYVTAYTLPVENETYTENNNDTKWVRVCPDQPPTANFIFEPEIEPNIVLVGHNVTFNASTSNDDLDWGTIFSYSWDWNDTTTDTTDKHSINHTFQEPRTYNVTLTVVDDKGLEGSASQLVTVEKKPFAFFTVKEGHVYGEGPPPYYVNDTLTLDGSGSTPNGGQIVWYYWEFDDNTFENRTFPTTTHVYTSPGYYYVTLTVADNNTLTDSYQRVINIVIGFPVADFEIYPLSLPYYVNDTLKFDASASYDSDWGHIDWHHWDFGDSTPVANETAPIIYHKYIAEGNYTVTLIVTDNDNLNSTPFNMTVSVSLRVYLKVEPRPVTANPGEKALNINITITDVEDLKSFKFKLNYTSNWLPPTWPLLLGKPWEFVNGSFLGPQFGPEGMRWNLKEETDEGEGFILIKCNFTDIVPVEERTGTGTLVNIVLSVKTSGNSSLSLTETQLLNSNGEVILHEVEHGYFYTTWPVADFTYSPRPPPPNQAVTFDASLSYDPDNSYNLTSGPIANYTWNFGDGTNGTGITINHTFTSGLFPVNLTVTDDDGESWWIIYPVPTSNVTLYVEPCWLAFNETTRLHETAGILPINVTVTNNAKLAETFTIKVYANDTIIGIQNKTISAGGSESLNFPLNTDGLPKGNYNISAHVAGNIKHADYLVTVYLTGDVDRDGDVDIYDIVKICEAYGFKVGDPEYEMNLDLNCDGKIDIYDIVIACNHYGEEDP